MRTPPIQLDTPPATWTKDEAALHLHGTFDMACRGWPDLMETYVVRLVDIEDPAERVEIMRTALRETLSRRFPMYGEAVQ